MSEVVEVKMVVPHNQPMVGLLGQEDRFLKMVEDAFGCRIVARGNEIDIKGDARETDSCTHLFEELIELLEEGLVITTENLAIAIDMVRRGEELQPTEGFKEAVLTARGVRVSMGHSNAIAAQTRAVIHAGATSALMNEGSAVTATAALAAATMRCVASDAA